MSAASVNSNLGSKVRNKRRGRNLTQAELARRLGISASYLNLIEHNQRPLTATLLIKLAQEFGLELSDFAADDDRRTAAHLLEAFSDPVFEEHELNSADVRELASSSPAIARAVLTLYEQFRRARETLAELAEDSYAHQESQAGGASGIDPTRSLRADALPSEEVNDFIQRHMNYFDELEELAEALWVDAKLKRGARFAGMAEWLGRRGIGVQLSAGEQRIVRRYDSDLRRISLSEALPPSSRNFQLAAQVALICHHDVLERLTDDEPGLSSSSSRTLARLVLANYFAGAVLMPYDSFVRSAKSQRYDVELLSNRFGTSFEQVCHRLTTLRRPEAEGVPFHMLRVDIAGNISKRFSGSGIRFARFSGACPRWNVFRAFQTPGLIRVQTSIMPDGDKFFCVARTVAHGRGGYGAHRATLAVGLGCPLEYAHELVYADGVDLDEEDGMLSVGVTCRLCERRDCEQRVLPSLRQPLQLREDIRGVSMYTDPES
ncbi:anaerobic benzoate catabolism transcriptional regulator [Enhygromyxa salina]|uniref:Anaerobic benzoate catabolism transcriptional regulator n=1 Tax=Enhygromyxa salina TaxID=215803 RepID=A0A2S9XHP2_9BACT|nr:short-chain fatty acyl-CoA regulator family protein [Enhygromyxa salina]PRP92357.1 anaerobic benzoate catabolism transcriptional regulator [Enhygromyxa salina]